MEDQTIPPRQGRGLTNCNSTYKEELKDEDVMGEGEYVGGHRDLYKDTMMEDQPLLISLDGSSHRAQPERCTGPLYSQDCTQKDHSFTQHYQEENLKFQIKKREKEEETCVRSDQQSIEEVDMMGTIKEEEEETCVRSDQQPTEESYMMGTSKDGEHSLDFGTDDSSVFMPILLPGTMAKRKSYINIEDLIIKVQDHPELYDKSHPEYRNTRRSNLVWHEIAEAYCDRWDELPSTVKKERVKEVKSKWRSVKDQYRREWMKENTQKSSSGSCYKSSYCHYQSLSFLKRILAGARTEDSLQEAGAAEEEEASQPSTSWAQGLELPSARVESAIKEETAFEAAGSHVVEEDLAAATVRPRAGTSRALTNRAMIQTQEELGSAVKGLMGFLESNRQARAADPSVANPAATSLIDMIKNLIVQIPDKFYIPMGIELLQVLNKYKNISEDEHPAHFQPNHRAPYPRPTAPYHSQQFSAHHPGPPIHAPPASHSQVCEVERSQSP